MGEPFLSRPVGWRRSAASLPQHCWKRKPKLNEMMFDERECVMCRCDVQALLPPALSAEDAAAMLTTHLPGTLKLLGAAGKRKDGEGEGGVVLLETVETLT